MCCCPLWSSRGRLLCSRVRSEACYHVRHCWPRGLRWRALCGRVLCRGLLFAVSLGACVLWGGVCPTTRLAAAVLAAGGVLYLIHRSRAVSSCAVSWVCGVWCNALAYVPSSVIRGDGVMCTFDKVPPLQCPSESYPKRARQFVKHCPRRHTNSRCRPAEGGKPPKHCYVRPLVYPTTRRSICLHSREHRLVARVPRDTGTAVLKTGFTTPNTLTQFSNRASRNSPTLR